MNSSKQLYDLQEIDREISESRDSLATVRARLEDNQALLFAQSQVEEAQTRLQELHARQREVEMELETLREKIEPLEKKLYGGTVVNPRELSGMEEEIKHLKSRLGQEEDRLLEVMESVEEAQSSLGEAQENLARVDAQRQQELEQLLEQQKHLTNELPDMERQRGSVTSQLPSSTLSLYERLWSNKQGHAVAKVERGMCQGCRITLPTKMLQQARAGQGLVQCNSCERILYVS